jgi:hypothetical protein
MTPRERRDMPWIIALGVVVAVIVLFGLLWSY